MKNIKGLSKTLRFKQSHLDDGFCTDLMCKYKREGKCFITKNDKVRVYFIRVFINLWIGFKYLTV